MSGPGPHIDQTELVPPEQQAAAAAPRRAQLPPYVSPARRINRAADDLVAALRLEVAGGRASAPLIAALAAFDQAAAGALP